MIVTQYPTRRFELVNINVTAGSTVRDYYFPNQPMLNGCKVQRIVCYYNEQMQYSMDNIALATLTDVRLCYLRLFVGDERVIRIPLLALTTIARDRTGAAGTTFNINGAMGLDNIPVYWNNSMVSYAAAPVNGGAYTFQFGVYYIP